MTELYDQEKDGTGHYCCPICLFWHDTPEQKQECMSRHGYTILVITAKETEE